MAVDHQSKIKIKEISIVELRGADLTRLSQGSWSWSEMAIHISPTASPRVVGLYLLLNCVATTAGTDNNPGTCSHSLANSRSIFGGLPRFGLGPMERV